MDTTAVLKATGFSGKNIKTFYFSIALTINAFGVGLGLSPGFGASSLIDAIPLNTESLPTIKTYPVDYNPAFYIIGGIFVVLTTYFAGYSPSFKGN